MASKVKMQVLITSMSKKATKNKANIVAPMNAFFQREIYLKSIPAFICKFLPFLLKATHFFLHEDCISIFSVPNTVCFLVFRCKYT